MVSRVAPDQYQINAGHLLGYKDTPTIEEHQGIFCVGWFDCFWRGILLELITVITWDGMDTSI